MSPQHTFRKSARFVQIIGSFGHHNASKGFDFYSVSDTETEPLCTSGGGLDLKMGLDGEVACKATRAPAHHGCPLPRDIHHGNMAVYVGKDRKRYVIKTHYLTHRLFKALLKRSEEEFEFRYQGGLPIMCEPVLFEHLLWLITTNDPAGKTVDLDLGDLLEFYDV